MYLFIFAALFSQILQKCQGNTAIFLNQATFIHAIGRSPHFVLFYAPWCGHCKGLLMSWNELAEKSNENMKVKIAKVNCVEDVMLCSDQNILAYPTMKFFSNGIVKRFDGSRNLNEFTLFVEDSLNEIVDVEEHEGLVTLTTLTFDAHTKTGLHFVDFYAPWCVHCQRLEPVWKAVAKYYQDNADITICKIDCSVEGDKCKQHGVSAFPTLKMYKDGQEIDKYRLSRSMDILISYINSYLSAYGLTEGKAGVADIVEQKDDITEEGRVVEEPIQGEIPDKSSQQNKEKNIVVEKSNLKEIRNEKLFHSVLELVEETFDAVVMEPTFVMFYVPWCKHCQLLKPVWGTLAATLQYEEGPVIARVDCSTSVRLCQKHQISGYPTLILFKDEKRYFYNRERTVESLKKFTDDYYHGEL